MATITTPRPPLNLFEVVRQSLGPEWATAMTCRIRAEGPNPRAAWPRPLDWGADPPAPRVRSGCWPLTPPGCF
jgi:hypothetical protein